MIKKCAICGKTFEPTSNRQKYCSPACKNESRKKYEALYRVNVLGRKPREKTLNALQITALSANSSTMTYDKKICPYCGAEFFPKHHLQKYCCKECAELEDNEMDYYRRLDNPDSYYTGRTYEQHINNFRRAAAAKSLYWDATC